MDISTGNWFEYLREEVLTEGIRDIGLPEFVIDRIEEAMPNASEKAKMYIGNNWKKSVGSMRGAYTPNNLKYVLVTKLIDDYGDYVQLEDPRQRMANPVARTVEPLDTDNMSKPRQSYDDERIKQAEQVSFVLINLRNAVGKPMGTWRKAFMKGIKALSKAGIPSEKVESTKEYLANFYRDNFDMWWNGYDDLITFLNDDPTNYELIKDQDSLREANAFAQQYFLDRENPEQVLHQFDDGSYWYDLQTSNCSVEASRMGHCGDTPEGSLYSLRKKQSKRRDPSSYVTIAAGDNVIYQIKGRENLAPPEETWDHIVWFVDNMGIEEIRESGEHSQDAEGLQDMVQYVAGETGARTTAGPEAIAEQAEEYCRNVDDRFYDNRDELGLASIGYEVQDFVDAGDTVYVSMSAEYEFTINLGWPGVESRDGMYRPMAGPDSDEPLELEDIPGAFGTEQRSFASEIGLDDMAYELPGDDADYEYEVVMLVGAQPDNEDFDPNYPKTAHLRVRLMSNETVYADEDGEVREYDDWADSMLEYESDLAPESIENIRQALAEGDYIEKTRYDRDKQDLMNLTDLDKWHVKEMGSGLEFDWTADDRQPLHYYPQALPTSTFMYATGTGNVVGGTSDPKQIMIEIFGYGQRYGYANIQGIMDASIASRFAAKLNNAVREAMATKAKGQQDFDFGPDYVTPQEAAKLLADDTDFVVFPSVKYNTSSPEEFPTFRIAWLYRMRVGAKSGADEVGVIKDIAAYLNENPQLVDKAANETIKFYVDEFIKKLERRKSQFMGNQVVQDLINRSKQQMDSSLEQLRTVPTGGVGAVARVRGFGDDLRERGPLMLDWFESNYANMNEYERYVLMTRFLIPMSRGNFSMFRTDITSIDEDGKPKRFDYLVRKLDHKATGRPMNESIEDQINRIDRLLNERDPNYDLRVYSTRADLSMQKDVGGEVQQTQTEIRGIEGVTTVRAIGDSRDVGTSQVATYQIKFELLGSVSREEYRKNVLIPGLMKIKGLRILRIGKAELADKPKTLKEYGAGAATGGGISNFGGVATGLGFARMPQAAPMPTPRKMIQQIIDDWVEGGVMDYDRPMNTNDSSYHVMVPVEELLPFIGKEFRAPKDAFDGMYQNFIEYGAQNPVYFSIGKNGRAKITGNEDIVWFAKKSGLDEVPVFFSYQAQV